MAEREMKERPEFLRVAGEHVRLERGRLELGPLSVDFHHHGGALGFDAYCCRNDFSDCVLRKDKETCADNSDRPITVWQFTG